jgi:hypothetical protein
VIASSHWSGLSASLPHPNVRFAEASRLLRALRREIMAANGWSLRDLYRTLETPGTNRLRDFWPARQQHIALKTASAW